MKGDGAANQIRLEHGEPIRFGPDLSKGVVLAEGAYMEVADVAAVGQDRLLVHDAYRADPSLAFMLARLSPGPPAGAGEEGHDAVDASGPTGPTPIGVFRQVHRPVYGIQMQRQIDEARAQRCPGDLAALLAGGDTWQIP